MQRGPMELKLQSSLQWSWRWRGQANEALLKVRRATYLSPA